MLFFRVKLMPSNNVDIIKIRPETEAFKEGIHVTPAERQPLADAALRQSAACQPCGKLRVYSAIRNVSTRQRTETDLHASLSYVIYRQCFASFSPDVKRGQNEWKNGKKIVLKCAIPVVLLKHVIKRI